jgi:pilus assembly protein CpaF
MDQNEILKALGPLASLYTDPEIFEIMVDAPDRVIVDRKGILVDAGVKIASTDELQALIEGILALGGVVLGPEQTSGHLRFPDGSRVLAVIPPTAITGPYLVLRKTHSSQFNMEQLIGWGSITREEYQVLQSAIQSRLNILVAGGTGSGKTTFANVLTDEFPDDERVIVVEAMYELQPRGKRFVRLSADNSPDHSFSDLIKLAARMRPDRLVLGELTGPEVMKALEVFNMGHDGSLATMHAANPEDALARLETMCLMANLGLGLAEIRMMIASAIQLITYLQRLPDGSRKLTHIVELRGLENGRYMLNPLFRYNPETHTIEPTGAVPGWK